MKDLLRSLWLLCLLTAISPTTVGASDATPDTERTPEGASAQATIPVSEEETAPQPDSKPTLFDPITVTATRRQASPRRLPLSITALDGRELESAGAVEMRDFLRSIPGVALGELQSEIYRISIRGIDSDNGGVTSQTSGVFIDDVPFNDPFFNQIRPDLPPFDLEGVEILKGPQGTLFGGSGLAGAVRYRLADAAPGIWETRSFAQYMVAADGAPHRLGGAVANLPLGEEAALRLVGIRRLAGGIIDDLNSGTVDTDRTASTSGRALLRWHPSERLSVGLKSLTQRTRSDDRPWAENAEGRFERTETLGLSPSLSEFDLHSLELAYQLSWAELISGTSVQRKYHESRNAGGERLIGVSSLGQPVSLPSSADVDGVVQEFRLISPDSVAGEWQWLAGVFAQRYAAVTIQDAFADTLPSGSPANVAHFVGDVTAQELALFGEASRRFLDRWTLTTGLRGYRVKTEGTVDGTGALVAGSGNAEQHSGGKVAERGVNPKLAVQYDIAEQASVYASAARGYRFGGIQIVAASVLNSDVPTTYDSDRVWNYELGLRSRWLEDRLQADGAVYYIDWKDPQVQSTTGGSVPFNVIANVGAARSYGAEVALRYLPPLAGLDLQLAAGYTNARTTEAFAAPNGTVPSGTRLPGYPEYQVTAGMDYAWIWRSGTLIVSLSHAVYGVGNADLLRPRPIYDYRTTDARLTLRSANGWGSPALSFGVANLADERAAVSAVVINEEDFYIVYCRPRTLDLRLELGF